MLGGINVIPKPGTVPLLADRTTPTIVLGAYVLHPAPGASSRPSYAAVVGSVDSDASKYVAITRAQQCRVEMIEDLTDMIAHVIKKSMQYRKEVEKKTDLGPRRILFYRESISEGQFKECKECEAPRIFSQYLSIPGGRSDRSGNAPAGLVVDRGITSPAYRPGHLCLTTNIQACDMAKQHYDPDGAYGSSDLDTTSQPNVESGTAGDVDGAFRFAFQPVHGNIG
ncbi:hypothetical protein FRC00_006750, partial [Tulasnella sp. 408]